MAKFITIGYGDEAGYRSTSEAVRSAAHEHDAQLVAGGAVMGIAGPPVQVRNHGGERVAIQNGPFLQANLPVAGFALIEAADLQQAIERVAGTPCAVAQGVVEIWPLQSSAS